MAPYPPNSSPPCSRLPALPTAHLPLPSPPTHTPPFTSPLSHPHRARSSACMAASGARSTPSTRSRPSRGPSRWRRAA
eukprot:347242-Chlamydomonas_euryale.AAC.1